MTCTACGQKLPLGAAFCPYCGARRALTEPARARTIVRRFCARRDTRKAPLRAGGHLPAGGCTGRGPRGPKHRRNAAPKCAA